MRCRRTLFFGALLATAFGAALAGSMFSPAGGSRASTVVSALTPVPSPDPQLVANLSVFQRPRGSQDALPPGLSADIPSASAESNAVAVAPAYVGVNPSLSRLAFTTAAGDGVYVIPSNGGACVVDSHATISFCTPTTEILAGQDAASDDCSPSLPSNDIEVAGLLPDSAYDPEVVLSNGQTQPLAVQGNAYLEEFARSGPLPRQITWQSSTGVQTMVDANVPSYAGTETCVTPADIPGLIASGKIPAPSGHAPAVPSVTLETNSGS